MDSVESRFVIGPSNILFGSVHVCTFSAGKFTGCGSEGVKLACVFLAVHVFGSFRIGVFIVHTMNANA